MNQRRIFSIVALAIMVVSLVFGGNIPVAAQTPKPPPPGGGTTKEKQPKITQADREAAAQRAADGGLVQPDMATADMAMAGDAPRYFSHPNYANSPLPGNIVAEWNAIAQEILQPTPMPGMPMTMGGISMSTAFVYLAYMQAAVYDALVAIEGGYQPYNLALAPDPTASREAAVATAAYNGAGPLPAGRCHPPAANTPPRWPPFQIAPPRPPVSPSANGRCNGIIALRTGDGLMDLTEIYTVLPPGPGIWEPTMLPDGTVIPPVDPWMATLTAVLARHTGTIPPRSSPRPWMIRALCGGLNRGQGYRRGDEQPRTPEQTAVAQFWTTNMVIQTNAAYRQLAASRGLNLLDTARLMAMGNMVATDSLIATFDAKYTYSFWRPITAIRHTNPDGTYSATELNTWMPAVMIAELPRVCGRAWFLCIGAG